jgi:hypothetical protein
MDCKILHLSKNKNPIFSILYSVESFLGSTSTPTTVQQSSKTNTLDDLNSLQPVTVNYNRQYDCLNRITGQGLQIQYRFPRTPFRGALNMVHIELIFTNTTTNKDIQSIKFLKSVCFVSRGFFYGKKMFFFC